jgi:pimeloyl-ACP methyl ester carboxylesterase
VRARVSAASIALTLAGCLQFHAGPVPGAPAADTYLDLAPGLRIRYRDAGEGPAVVLIHGFASALDTWTHVVATLQPKHRVISLDLMGFGWSSRPDPHGGFADSSRFDYSPQGQARLVLQVLDARGVGRCDVVAHSWGASVALSMAQQAPERVRRLALYDAWTLPEQLPSFLRWAQASGVGEALFALWYDERPEDRLALAFHDPSAIGEPFVDDVMRALERPGTKAAALAATRGQSGLAAIANALPRVHQPVLLLWGRDDRVSWLADGERLARSLPDARLATYANCGHLPMIEAKAASTRDLVQFLETP